ncbi:Golgi phosphoprotein 3 (GPP34) [Pseudonocardia ammonioxydans]|uniref:Golgi phosphoprotein 3 (GPP34) n=1 Tax=Pseudonocardia ammonioxydans TaxID=260086 RepID=A0A1I5CIJ4_PSUAM|nr:GPP34 family phosphoprotein [Pseudonocardia ammonioxydans]SFN86471.1 Golgi phosphoprotein 3 (GPP34) [Pseudonocardia ammonioxydans]
MGDLLLSEELLLIGLHDETGKPDGWFQPNNLHGALICDLIERGAVTVDGKKKVHPGERVPEHPALRQVWETITADAKVRSVSHWTSTLPWKHTKPAELVAERLVDDGVLTREEGKVLGIFRTTRLPAADPAPERALRERLRGVLVTGIEPSAHDALLVTLLNATSQVKAALDGLDKEQRKAGTKRAAQIAKGLKDNPVVKAQYDAAMAAVMTTVVATAVVTSSGGS